MIRFLSTVGVLIGSFLVATGQTSSCTRTLSDPIALDSTGMLTLQQMKNTDDQTFTMRITYTGGHSWIGIGINFDGRAKMSPVQAVIGRADNGGPSVSKYRLVSSDEDASGVIPLSSDLQVDLAGVSFVQTDDGTTSILEFTHPLADVAGDMVVTDSSFWVYAVGNSDNAWTGEHRIKGGFQLPLTDSCLASNNSGGSSSNTNSGNTSGNQPTTDTNVVSGNDGDGDEGEYDGDYDGDEGEYDGDYDGDGEQQGGSTTTTTTTDSSSSTGIVFASTEAGGTKTLYLIHGILMAVAWGVLAPLAIGTSLCRNMVSCLRNDGRWFKVHLYLNILVILLTMVGFFLAVAAISKNGDDHFTENGHTKIGLAIFVLVLVQALNGFLRPHAPHAAPPTAGKESRLSTTYVRENGSDDGPSGEVVPEEAPAKVHKTTARLAWEVGHRVVALVMIALAWLNCTTGIEIFTEDYVTETDSAFEADTLGTAIFWSVTGGISSLVLLLGIIQRVIR